MRTHLVLVGIIASLGPALAAAGDVKAVVKSGVLTISDSSGDDSFTIDQTALVDTAYRVTPDPGTTINGSGAAQVFSNVTNDVRLKANSGTDGIELDDLVIGRDLTLTSSGAMSVQLVITNGLDVGRDLRVDSKAKTFVFSSGGAGNVVRRDARFTLRGTVGNSVAFVPLNVLRNTTVKGSNGTDVFVAGANSHLVGNVSFDCGAGSDTYVDAVSTVVGGDFKVKGKGGTKTCVLSGFFHGDVVTDLGNGDGNTVVATTPTIGGSLRAKSGSGSNSVLVASGCEITGAIDFATKGDGATANFSNVTTGDDVRIKFASGTNITAIGNGTFVGGDVRVDGGNGQEQISLNTSTVLGDVRINLGAAPDLVADAYSMLLGTIGGDLVLNAGAGMNAGAIEDVTVLGGVKLNFGSGNNTYVIDGGSFGSILAKAGSGNDNFTLTGGTIETVADVGLLLGSGNNAMAVAHTTCGRDLIVKTGGGNDSIVIATTTIVGTQDIQLGGGMNSGP